MTFLRACLCGLWLLVSLGAWAETPLAINTQGRAFGLPNASPAAAFVEKLGAPSAEVQLSNGRRGLMFGNSILLVFAGDRLIQARCWLVPEFTGDLYLGWLQDVKGFQKGFELDGQLRLGMLREQTSPFVDGLTGEGDERSNVMDKNGSEVWLGFAPASDYRIQAQDEAQALVSITVNFPSPSAPSVTR